MRRCDPTRDSASAIQLPSAPIEFRIGINLGEIVIEGRDIFGDGVNVAARLEGQAPKGGILASDVVHTQVSGKVGVKFVDCRRNQTQEYRPAAASVAVGRQRNSATCQAHVRFHRAARRR